MIPFPLLQTPRLILREITPSDIHVVYEGLSHPDVIRYYGVQYDSLASTEVQMKWFAQLIEEETGIWWAITDRATHTFLGAAGFNNRDTGTQIAEIGFWLLPDHWGKGYIPEALDVIIDYGFRAFQLKRIEAFIETENAGSIAVINKKGFVHDNTMIDCEIKNGRPISLMVFSLSAPSPA